MTFANGELSTPAGDAVRNKYRREGAADERERIIKLLESLADEDGDLYKPMDYLIALIKGEHKHDIDVFGAPCACGTHHEYCNNCNWVEPCEVEEENK